MGSDWNLRDRVIYISEIELVMSHVVQMRLEQKKIPIKRHLNIPFSENHLIIRK